MARAFVRALFVIHNPAFGGGHNEILEQRAGLEAAGWSLMIATCDEPSTGAQRLAQAGLDVMQMPLHRLRATTRLRPHAELVGRFVPEVQALRRLIREQHVDVVQAHGETNVHSAVAGRLEHVGVCWHLYDTAAPAAVRRAMRPVVTGLAGSVTATGQATVAAYPGLERFSEKVIVTFPPADPKRFRPDPGRRTAARAELGLAADALAIGTVGNRNPRKGHDLLIEAAAELLPSHPQAQVVIMGGLSPAHPEYEASLHAAVARHGLERQISFVDPGSRVPELLPAIDVFVMPSHPGEGMPTVILEAMACALPVVATDVAATREEVEDGVTGLIVAPGDRAGLVAGLSSLAADAGLRARMGSAGRARMLTLFTPERAVANRLRAWDLAISAARSR